MLSSSSFLTGMTCLMVLMAGCSPPSQGAGSADIQDFGPVQEEVRSVGSKPLAEWNLAVTDGASAGETWTLDPILVVMRMTGEGLHCRSKSVVVEAAGGENFNAAIVTLTENGYLDDSIGGIRYRCWLEKDDQGLWRFTRVLWAQLCRRPGQIYYAAEPCP